jgi:hypothetical protein
MITAYDGTSLPYCNTNPNTQNFLNPTFMSNSTNIDKIKNEYKDLATYLKGFPGKTFIISNWEGDNAVYCLSAYGATSSTCPNYASHINAFKSWVNAYSDGIRLAGASNVYSAVEFNIVRDLKSRGMPSVLYDVVPNVNTDYISYSSYESINPIISGDNGSILKSDISTILSVSGKNSSRLIIGEYGFGTNVKNNLQLVTNTLESTGIKDYFVWALLNHPAGFELYSPNGALSESGKYVCSIAGGTNCN